MDRFFITRSVKINASASKVWSVFTDPAITRKMGGEYVSDWKVGSDLGWKGIDGKMLTKGTILQFEPQHILQHDLFDLTSENKIMSVITYTLEADGQFIILHAREDLLYSMDDKTYHDTCEGWDIALNFLKQIAEKL